MNIKRGLLRLWLVLSLFWVSIVGIFGIDHVKSDKWWKGEEWWEKDPIAFLPVACTDARGVQNVDYEKLDAFEPWNRYRTPSSACYYTHDKFKIMFPEYKDTPFGEISNTLYQKIGWSPKFDGDRFEQTKIVIAVAFLPPLLLLIIGSLVGWALAGFRTSEKP